MNPEVNDLVVVNKLEDSTVYTVAEVNEEHHTVHLKYVSGVEFASGGWVPRSICMKPSNPQLESHAKYIYRYLTAVHNRG